MLSYDPTDLKKLLAPYAGATSRPEPRPPITGPIRLESNLDEISSAASSIPSDAVDTEGKWTKIARAFAHEAALFPALTEALWQILDAISRRAPGYDEADNRARFDRYVAEAFRQANPITIASFFYEAKQNGWPGWAPSMVTSQSNAIPSSGLSPSVGAIPQPFTFGIIPHRHFLWGVDLLRGEITLLASPGGIGKSTLVLGILISLAIGRELLGEKIYGDDIRVLYINAEDSNVEIRRRVWAFCIRHGVSEQELSRFYLLGCDDWQVQKLSFLKTNERGASMLDETAVAQFEDLLKTIRPRVVVLDPLVAFCAGGNLNDNALMSLVMRALKGLAYKYDCSILIIHHLRKGGDFANPEAIGGAAAIVNLARRALNLAPMTAEEAKELGVPPSVRGAFIKAIASKSNLAPRTSDASWYELCSVTLPNPEPPIYQSGDRVQAIVRHQFPQIQSVPTAEDQVIQRAILDIVDHGKDLGGTTYPYSPNVTGANNQRSLLDDAMAAAEEASGHAWHREDLRAAVERCIKGLKAGGALVEEEIKSARFRRCRGLAVDWSKTPWAAEKKTRSAADAIESGIADEDGPPPQPDCEPSEGAPAEPAATVVSEVNGSTGDLPADLWAGGDQCLPFRSIPPHSSHNRSPAGGVF